MRFFILMCAPTMYLTVWMLAELPLIGIVVSCAGASAGGGLPGSAHPGHHGADDSRRPEELPPLPSTQGGTTKT